MDLAGIPLSAGSIASSIALSVANIDDPSAELGAIAGAVKGEFRLCYQTVAGADEWTLYAWDSASSAGASTPYRINGTSGQWQAIAGKYGNSGRNFNSTLSVGGVLTVTDTTEATFGGASPTVGSIATAGGIAAVKRISCGDNLEVGTNTKSGIAITLNGLAASTATLKLQDAGVLRWDVGRNASGNFTFVAYDATGVLVDTPLTIVNGAGSNLTSPRGYTSTASHQGFSAQAAAAFINLGGSFTQSKTDSQGTAISSKTDAAIAFNGASSDRGEISWYRGSRTCPEYSIREHTSADTGGQHWAGAGTANPTLSLSITSSGIKIETSTASSSTSTGALQCLGGAGIAGQITGGGVIKTTDTTEASAVGTASVTTAGGLGVTKRSFLGTISSSFAGNVIAGVADATTAVAGQVGEVLSSVVSGAAVASTVGVGNVTSLSITAGNWLLGAMCVFSGGTTGLSSGSTAKLSIVSATATNGTPGSTMAQRTIRTLVASDLVDMCVTRTPIQVTGTNTFYLTEELTYAAGTPTASAVFYAVRIR